MAEPAHAGGCVFVYTVTTLSVLHVVCEVHLYWAGGMDAPEVAGPCHGQVHS